MEDIPEIENTNTYSESELVFEVEKKSRRLVDSKMPIKGFIFDDKSSLTQLNADQAEEQYKTYGQSARALTRPGEDEAFMEALKLIAESKP